MERYLLVINAGSSSIKFTVFRTGLDSELTVDVSGEIGGIGSQPDFTVSQANGQVLEKSNYSPSELNSHALAIAILMAWLCRYINDSPLLAVGHRVVHGGRNYINPVLMTPTILHNLKTLIPLAPLHQPHNLATIQTFSELMPDLPQVACFDTAFHRDQPEIAQRFALPRQFIDNEVRRYGFHGLSYEYIVSVLPQFDSGLSSAKIIVAHLGNGASLCAIDNGRSVATTMGFSPLDGLVMGTRCGSLDAGVLLYLMDHYGMDARKLEHLLYHESGLLGVSGISSDMRSLLTSDHPHAKEAIDLFVYHIGREIGSLTATLSGIDALIFTGGIGEKSARIRSKICFQAGWLGLKLNEIANEAGKNLISSPESQISTWIMPTNENLIIARHTLQCLSLPNNPITNQSPGSDFPSS